MLFNAYGIHNRAIWNAMQLHAQLIEKAGEPILFLVHEQQQEIVRESFPSHPILTYKNYADFLQAIKSSEESSIFTSTFSDTLKALPALLFKKLKIYYWVQGIEAEESYMRNRSTARRWIISQLEKISLHFSEYQILVSPYMKTYLENKHNMTLDHSIIIPCTSDLRYNNTLKIKNSFTYVGGMAVWQRFDIMLGMFNRIAIERPDAHFYVATGAIEQAKTLIQTHVDPQFHHQISVRSIDDRQSMEDFLNTMEYGFLIRDDDPVNNVSSPIKLAEYLSCGVNVIISDAVTSYAPLVESYGAGISVRTIDDIDKLQNFPVSAEASLHLYNERFDEARLIEIYRGIL